MAAEKVKISTADSKDAELLTKLSVVTFRETFASTNTGEDMDKYIAEEMNQERLTDELNDTGNIFFLARLNEIPAGYAKIRATNPPPELSNNNALEIERIYVLQEYQGKKIGAALMSHCISHAMNQKHDIAWLGVWEHNYKAVKFYKQWGFELFGAHPFILGNDKQTDVLMKKMLK